MIVIDCEQGSEEWQDCRRGIPTASEFSRIVTPTGRLSEQRKDYMAELVAEWALGYSVVEWSGNLATERGHVLEPDALAYYSWVKDVTPQRVGFVYRDKSRMVGCSPDFVVDGCPGELKCPYNAGKHLMWLIKGECPREHRTQVQGQMWVMGAERCDFMSYYPDLPEFLISVEPDETLFKALDKYIPQFCDELLEMRQRLAALGVGDETA